MKLDDLIQALAAEVELARPQLDSSLDALNALDLDDPTLMDALDEYSSQAQRMGEAAEMVGLPGLQAVCDHVVENSLLMAALPVDERAPLLQFLRAWPGSIVHWLRHLSDTSSAAGVVDLLRSAPSPMGEEQALKVMHMLGAMPLQVAGVGGDGSDAARPVLASPADVELVLPADVDDQLLEGFFQEAPEQARRLIALGQTLVAGHGNDADLATAKRLIHTLKGSGAIIGLQGLASIGHHLEDVLEHFERAGTALSQPAAEALLDAAYCLEQMVGHVIGNDDYPSQSQAVLQTVLDLANRLDRGETLEMPLERAAPAPTPSVRPPSPPPAAPDSALRVSLQRIEALFRVTGEAAVHNAAMEERMRTLAERSRELLAQNLRVQKRLFELEALVDVRALATMRSNPRRAEQGGFDPLEMDQYSELHSTAHALAEEAADARAFAARLDDEIAAVATVQLRQQRLGKDLQHLVIGTRMSEVGTLAPRLHRNVRSTAQATGKQAELLISGAETQIDTDVLARLAEPLMHLLRNAVDHGLEDPDERAAAGKPPVGRINIAFSRRGQQVVLRCDDDGRGLNLPAIRQRAVERGLIDADQAIDDDEIARLILQPGFSTRDTVSTVSGRGVGLDVVHDWATQMSGSVRVSSRPGAGCSIELHFAASLTAVHSLIVEVAGERYALPSMQVEQAIPRGVGRFEMLADRLVYRHARQLHPALRLAAQAGLPFDAGASLDDCDAVIVRVDDKTCALAVDRLLDSRELLVKHPGRYARHLRGVAGLAILGDGSVAVNLDLVHLLVAPADMPVVRPRGGRVAAPNEKPLVLVVDDALSVRNSLLQLVQDAGFRAETARDGAEAINLLHAHRPDVVLTDLEMPNINGIHLTSHIRGRDDLKGLPVIMITSRSQDKHRRMAREAGVDAYITKPYNDGELLQAIRQHMAA
jgi:chemosensory pili system protein ChpA (sensor histidine kinase/response regulator)